ncbi:hypothetical protein NJB93_21485 [Brucella intermedia]|uniref:hypothetical protein n=1 Tax=Brucella intermedia TaxID=94625 RepID=UPI00209B8C07|nr:hypothetical protein [Brucella intermedia]MCO7729119.1 hypothetical protein [Brucella intermedia]
MFKISFSPQRSNLGLTLAKQGDTLTVNGDPLDFSALPEGGEYPAEAIENDTVIGGVKRVDGVIHVAILLPYSNPDAPLSVTFPKPITVTADGPITLPEGRIAEVEHAD